MPRLAVLERAAGSSMTLRWIRPLASRLPAGIRAALRNRHIYAWVIIAFGAALRLRQYFEFLSMGNDEAALARNIVERDLFGLTRPLDYRQGAPILFLFIQKLAITVFGNWDYVLAIFPLIAGLLALYFFYRIADHYQRWIGLIALFAFAVSRQIVNYTSIQKQYSSDVLTVVLLLYLYAWMTSRKPRPLEFALLAIVGAFAIWTAHPAVFILPGVGLALLLHARKLGDRGFLRAMAAIGVVWGASMALNYLVSLRGLAADPYFETYWAYAFMPWPPWARPGWFAETYQSLLYMSINRTLMWLAWGWLIVCALGLIALWLRQRDLAGILICMFVLALAASAMHLYPLRYRLLLFALPAVYLLLAEGIRRIFRSLSGIGVAWAGLLSAALCLGLLWPGIVDAKRTLVEPVRLYDMRGIVEHVDENWESGDAVLVSGGGETYAYYSESAGLPPGTTIIDANHRIIRYRTYLQLLDRLSSNRRVWVVFAHFEDDPSYQRYSDYLQKQGLVDHVKTIGFARAYLWIPKQWVPPGGLGQ